MYKELIEQWGNKNVVNALEELGLGRFFGVKPSAKWFNKQLSSTYTNYAQVLELSFSLRNSDTNEWLEVWLVPDHWREIVIYDLFGWKLWKAKNVDVDSCVAYTLRGSDSYVVLWDHNYRDYHAAYRVYLFR